VRISAIAWARLKRHKNESLMAVFAIILTVLTSTVVFTTLDLFNEKIQAYYKPLKGYNMILEKHGTLVQFFPLDSSINDSIVETMEQDLNISVHPAAFEIVDETIQSVIPNVLVGVSTKVLDDLLANEHLYGRTPQPGSNEVVTGNSMQFLPRSPLIGENITVFNTNFTVVGTVSFDNPMLDNYIFTTYEAMQVALHLNGTCNILFVEGGGPVDEDWLESEIESRYPSLKLITSAEADVLASDVIFNASSWNGFLVIFTLFICISFPLTAFFINHDKIFKEIWLLRLIGTPRVKILLFKCQENLTLFAIGAIIGYIIATFVFPILTIAAISMQGIAVDAWGLYTGTIAGIQPNVLNGFVTLSSALLSIGPAVLLLPYGWTIGRVERTFTARKKR